MPSTFRVSSLDGLNAALKAAVGGDVILLAKTEKPYSLQGLSGFRPGGTVTVTSADPDDRAVIETLVISSSSNIRFEGLSFDSRILHTPRPSWIKDINISSCDGVTIAESTMIGGAKGMLGVDADAKAGNSLMQISNSKNITITENEISHFYHGIAISKSSNVDISDNEITKLQGDGIRIVESKFVDIEKNYIHDFLGTSQRVNHTDMIQMWSASTTSPSENISIRSNILDSGDGAGAQAIFLGNEAFKNNPNFLYKNIDVSNNIIRNGHTNGIVIGQTVGVTVDNNTMLFNNETPLGGSTQVTPPRVKIASQSTDVVVTDNLFYGFSAGSGAVAARNVWINESNESSPANPDNIFHFRDLGTSFDPEAFAFLPSVSPTVAAAGSRLSVFDPTPDAITALFSVEKIGGLEDSFRFDASRSADPKGPLPETASFRWDFGDGATATGRVVEKVFATPGERTVTLTVVHADGAADQHRAALRVAEPVLLAVDFDPRPYLDESAYRSRISTVTAASPVAGRAGEGLNLDASDSIAFDRGNRQLFGLEQMSIALSFKLTTPVHNGGAMAITHNSFSLGMNTAGRLTFQITDADGRGFGVTSSVAVADAAWHRLALSYDSVADQTVMFLDGQEVGRAAAGAATRGVASWGFLLGHYSWGNSFDGVLDDVVVTADPISASAARADYDTIF